MDKKLRILFAASEVAGYAKTGGLADVAAALPKALQKQGHEVIVVMPRYYTIDPSKLEKLPTALGVPMGPMGEFWAAVYTTKLPKSEVQIYFIDFEHYFGRHGLYESDDGSSYHDNDNRFIFFSKAVLQLSKMLHFNPDIVHANDWHTASIPLLIKTRFVHDFAHTASVLTIHNIQHQGNFFKGAIDVLEVGWNHFNANECESYDTLNMLKCGIYHAEAVSTVSHRYAQEIQTPEFSFGLDNHLRGHAHKIFGVLNGVDYDEWNPSIDPYLEHKYDVDSMQNKGLNKKEIQEHFGLEVRDDVALIGFVGRFAEQKGIGLLASAIHGILDEDVQIVMLGTGEKWAEGYFSDVAYHRENFAIHVGYSEALAHKIEAGSDMFLMPSLFEPCGLNQIYSLRYGTLPIVRATGGLDDTIVNFDEQHHNGNGFKFYDATSEALYYTVLWALRIYYTDKEAFLQMQVRAMQEHFSWLESAKGYEAIYRFALEQRNH